MILSTLADLFDSFELELKRDPSGDRIEGAFRHAVDEFKAFLHSGAAPSGAASDAAPATTEPPADDTSNAPPPAPPDAGAPAATEPTLTADNGADPSLYRCPACGRYWTAPATCSIQHPPEPTVTLDEVGAPVGAPVVNAGEADSAPPAPDAAPPPDAGDNSKPPDGSGSPDWPPGS